MIIYIYFFYIGEKTVAFPCAVLPPEKTEFLSVNRNIGDRRGIGGSTMERRK